jgi:uncharacterized protein
MHKILIAGGTGFVGKSLIGRLTKKQSLVGQATNKQSIVGQATNKEKEYTVHILSRKKNNKPVTGVQFFYWNPETNEYDPKAFEGVDCVVNLSGAGVADKRWTEDYKQTIITSRIQSIFTLALAMKETNNQVQTVINASATGWYGPDNEAGVNKDGFTEEDPPANTFFGDVCKQWEDAATIFSDLGKRLVILRIGVVLHPDGGMLKELLKPLRFGIATILGKPKRVISWIGMEDLCSMIIFAANNNIAGIYNAVSQQPATNRQLVIQLAKAKRRWFIPVRVPAFIIRMIAGEFSKELLGSVRVNGQKIAKAGFTFNCPDITLALAAR